MQKMRLTVYRWNNCNQFGISYYCSCRYLVQTIMHSTFVKDSGDLTDDIPISKISKSYRIHDD